jgi:YesN/AraC family two-component response regulator
VHPDINYALNSLLQTRPDIPDNIPIIRAYIQLILSRLLPQLELIKNRDTQSLSLASQLITYLSDHYTEPVTLDTLSKQLGISKYSISRIFSEKLHTGFNNYLNTLRIDYAKLLLQGSNHDILAISLMCGYENTRTFNRVFKTICGCQPREYRQKRR